MAITTEDNRTEELTTDGVETEFDFPLLIHDDSEVQVWYEVTDGEYIQLVLDTNYTVVFTEDGGTVTTIGPDSPYAAGKILIIRHILLTQQTNWLYNDNHSEQQHQDDFDRSAMRDIQIQDTLDRVVTLAIYSGTTGIILPEPAANYLLGWNAGGTNLANISIEAVAVLVSEEIELGDVPAVLTDLTDVTIAGEVAGHILRYDGTMWTNYADSNYQTSDATLTSIALLGTAADKMIYITGVDTWAETALTAFARSILDDVDEATFKATVNLEIGTDVLAQQTIGIVDNNLLEVDGGPNNLEYARFTLYGLEGRTEAEFKADFNLEIGTDVLAQQTIGIADNNLLEVDGTPNSGEYARFTANGLEGRTVAELGADGFLLADGSVALTGDWVTGAYDINIGEGGGISIGGTATADTLLIETSDTDNPTITLKTTNTAHQVDIYLDENETHDVVQLHGVTAGVDTKFEVVALDGQTARLQLYSGSESGFMQYSDSDILSFRNLKQDGDILFRTNEGGTLRDHWIDASTNKLKSSSGTWDFDNDHVVTTGNLTAGEMSQIGTATDYFAYDPAHGLGSGISAGTYFYMTSNDTGFGRTFFTIEGASGNGASRMLFKDTNSGLFINAYGDNVGVSDALKDSVAFTASTTTNKLLFVHSGTGAGNNIELSIGNNYANPDVVIENVSDVGFLRLPKDDQPITFGAGNDASILYDGTNLCINPKEVGTGVVDVEGNLTAISIDLTGTLTAVNVTINGGICQALSADGYDCIPGSDIDCDLISVSVDGNPKFWWDESADSFAMTKSLITSNEIINPKAKMTSIGGYAIKLTNKSGSNSVAGDIVIASTGTADAVALAGANELMAIGMFLDSGIADGSEAWIVVSGIADIHMDAGGCALGDRIITSATAGRGDVSNTPAAAAHFQEIGHAIEAAAANANARCVIHFL